MGEDVSNGQKLGHEVLIKNASTLVEAARPHIQLPIGLWELCLLSILLK